MPAIGLFLFLLSVLPASAPARQATEVRRLACDVFPAGMTRVDLARVFGEASLVDDLISVAEGLSQPGTTVFAGTPDHLDVFWNERGGARTLIYLPTLP